MAKYTVGIRYQVAVAPELSFGQCRQVAEEIWHKRTGIGQTGIGCDPRLSRLTFQSVITAMDEATAIEIVREASWEVCTDMRERYGHVAEQPPKVTVDHWDAH
jgi:hypothetical protein